jgi:hypothetical protein
VLGGVTRSPERLKCQVTDGDPIAVIARAVGSDVRRLDETGGAQPADCEHSSEKQLRNEDITRRRGVDRNVE